MKTLRLYSNRIKPYVDQLIDDIPIDSVEIN